MSFFGSLKSMLVALGKALGVATLHAPVKTTRATPEPKPITAPAVAGFVWRLAVDRFFLAHRLASIARLNTPAGRKPHGSVKRSAGLPAIPVARLGTKRTRLNANQGPRVLKPAAAMPLHSATIIPFPVGRNATGRRHCRLAKAA